nr:MAG TPA: hypothetical protein [Caudoviricetes sp.]
MMVSMVLLVNRNRRSGHGREYREHNLSRQ